MSTALKVSALALILVFGTAQATTPKEIKTDADIKQFLIEESIARYPGNCPCPYNVDRAGSRCGKRSAYSRPGGASPLCYISDISDDMVKEYRKELNENVPRSTSPLTYDRKQFGNWIDADEDCQDTRQEVLIEESVIPVTFKTTRQCEVGSGMWVDHYTGSVFTNPSLLDVDHVVPLKEAFLSGADQWSAQKKIEYANYLKNKDHLIAVYRGANRSKGAQDPARWLPPNQAYHREYVSIWLKIKKEWGLSMDPEEARVIQSILQE